LYHLHINEINIAVNKKKTLQVTRVFILSNKLCMTLMHLPLMNSPGPLYPPKQLYRIDVGNRYLKEVYKKN